MLPRPGARETCRMEGTLQKVLRYEYHMVLYCSSRWMGVVLEVLRCYIYIYTVVRRVIETYRVWQLEVFLPALQELDRRNAQGVG